MAQLAETTKKVEIFVVDKNKTRQGGAFFKYLNLTHFDLSKYGIFKVVDKRNYIHNCLYLALKEGGLSKPKLQQLIISLRNRTIHKCDLRKISEILEIHIELISIQDGLEVCRVEHYGKEHLEKYELGLMEGHYFINDRTDVTSYSLTNYNDVKYIK